MEAIRTGSLSDSSLGEMGMSSDDYGDKAVWILVLFLVFVAMGVGVNVAAPLAVAAFANEIVATIEVAAPVILGIIAAVIAGIVALAAALKR